MPRRRNDPVFRGYIYIMDDNWRIHSLNLTLFKNTQLNIVDSLNIQQTFLETADPDPGSWESVPGSGQKSWMPASMRFQYGIKLLKFRLSGYFLAVYDHYQKPMAFEDDFFSNEIVLVEEGANKKDSAYWTTRRPVPLTDEEREGYHEKDSIARLKESESYLDSVDAENNRFKPGKFFFPGYVYTDRYHKRSYRISPLLGGVKFNTVEGLAVEMALHSNQKLEDGRSWWV